MADINIALPDDLVRQERASFTTLAIGYEGLIQMAVEKEDIKSLEFFTNKAQEICDKFWNERKYRLVGVGPEKRIA